MNVLLDKIFPKSNPFGDDAWWEIYLEKINSIKSELQGIFCKKRLAREKAASEARKLACLEELRDIMAAARLRRKWEERDPKPREPEMFMVNGVSIPYHSVCSYCFWVFLKRHEKSIRDMESNPELLAFVKANWADKDKFDRWLCMRESGLWLDFPDDPLGARFCDYLSHIRMRDRIAKELMGRFLGMKYYPASFIAPPPPTR